MAAPTRSELHDLVDRLPAADLEAAAAALRNLRQIRGAPDRPIELRFLAPGRLAGITGILSLGGDAVEDSEAVYDE
jgi:hypothetical protein